MLPIKPICNPKKKRRDGTSLIFIQYCFSSEQRTLLNTEIAIPPSCWIKKKLTISKELPSEYGEAECLNDQLKQKLRSVEDLVALAEKQASQTWEPLSNKHSDLT